MNRSIWILPGITENSIQMVSAPGYTYMKYAQPFSNFCKTNLFQKDYVHSFGFQRQITGRVNSSTDLFVDTHWTNFKVNHALLRSWNFCVPETVNGGNRSFFEKSFSSVVTPTQVNENLLSFSFSIFPSSIYLSVEVVSFRQRITGSPTITCRKSIRQCPGSVRHLCRMTWVFIGSLIVPFEMVRSIFPNPSFSRPCWWCGGWSRSIAATAPALQLMADCFTSSSRSESFDLLATYVLFTYHNGTFKNVHNNDKTKGAQNMQTEEMGENTWEFEVEAPQRDPKPSAKTKEAGAHGMLLLVSRHSHRPLQAHGPCLRSPPFFSSSLWVANCSLTYSADYI